MTALKAFIEAHPVAVTVVSVLVILLVVNDWRRIRRRGRRL